MSMHPFKIELAKGEDVSLTITSGDSAALAALSAKLDSLRASYIRWIISLFLVNTSLHVLLAILHWRF
jgi:hypothetical protein